MVRDRMDKIFHTPFARSGPSFLLLLAKATAQALRKPDAMTLLLMKICVNAFPLEPGAAGL